MKSLVLLALVFLTGCGTQLQFVRNTSTTYQQKKSPNDVKLLYSEPSEAFDSVGMLVWDYYQPGFRAPSIIDAWPRLRNRAWQEGGDAVIVRQEKVPALTERNLRITAEVIRISDLK